MKRKKKKRSSIREDCTSINLNCTLHFKKNFPQGRNNKKEEKKRNKKIKDRKDEKKP
jgi:hypothetical protein